MLPPSISHIRYNKADNLLQIANDAAAAIKMGSGERKLLAYYAAQSTGFRPASATVMKSTGLSKSQVFRNRQKLIDHGLALMIKKGERNSQFVIDWSRAKIYASLDRKLTSKNSWFAPMVPPGTKYKAQRQISMFALRYGDLNNIVDQLSNMSEDDYQFLVRKVRDSGRIHEIRKGSDKRPDLHPAGKSR